MSLRFFHLDLISEKPCLYYNSYRRFSNLCGLVGTLLAFILIFSNALACFIIWVKGHDISVITTKETKDFSSKMNLSHTIFFYKLIQSDGSLVDHYNKNAMSPSYISKQVGIAVDFINVNYYEFRQIKTEEGFLFPKTATQSSFSTNSSTFRTIVYKNGKEFHIPNTLSVFQFSMNQEYDDKYQPIDSSFNSKYRWRFKLSLHCDQNSFAVPHRWLHLL